MCALHVLIPIKMLMQMEPRSLLTFTYSKVLSEIVIAGRFLSKLCTCDIWLMDSNIGIDTVHSNMQFFKGAFFCCGSKYNFEATVADENAVTELSYNNIPASQFLLADNIERVSDSQFLARKIAPLGVPVVESCFCWSTKNFLIYSNDVPKVQTHSKTGNSFAFKRQHADRDFLRHNGEKYCDNAKHAARRYRL